MRLPHGTMVILHPIQIGDDRFLPCVYGYAMTTRKAQGNCLKGPKSAFVDLLEELFQSSIDVQCGDDLGYAVLNYVTGYNAKASDSLSWKSKEWASDLNNSKWLQCYRLLCKRAPLVPELVLDFSSQPMMTHTVSAAPLYAPLPHYVLEVDGVWLTLPHIWFGCLMESWCGYPQP